MIEVLKNIGILLAAFAGMEVLSWGLHKYLFHGPLWFIHRTHHLPQRSFFEWNDLFSLGFATLSIVWILQGVATWDYRFWLGSGIALYGLVYFVLHDLFIHRRGKSFQTKNRYLLALRRAHKVHHKSLDRTPAESFGLLWVARKFFK